MKRGKAAGRGKVAGKQPSKLPTKGIPDKANIKKTGKVLQEHAVIFPESSFTVFRIRFLWMAKLSKIFQRMSFNVLREVSQYFGEAPSPMLTGLTEGRFVLYNFEGKVMKSKQLEIPHNRGTVLCPIDSISVVVLGLGYRDRSVYTVNTKTWEVKEMPSMHVHRASPALIKYNAFLYVFGGDLGLASVEICEKYSLLQGQWSDLPNMTHVKCYSWPCRYQDNVYLPNTTQCTRHVEVFNLVTETFRVAVVGFEAEGHCISGFLGDQLVVLCDSSVIRMHMRHEEAVQSVAIDNKLGAWSCCVPMQRGEDLFFVRCDKPGVVCQKPLIVRFSMTSGDCELRGA